MKTLTPEQFAAQYGKDALSKFSSSSPVQTGGNYVSNSIGGAFKGGVDKMKQGFAQAQSANNPLEAVESGLKVGSGAIGAAFSPLAPLTAPLGKGINYAADKISDIPAVQNFAQSKAGQTTARVAEDVGDLSTIAGAAAGAVKVPEAAGGLIKKFESNGPKIPPGSDGGGGGSVANGAMQATKNFASDVVPTAQRSVNSAVSKALGLTTDDLYNIAHSTHNEVGQFLADQNLIRNNLNETKTAITDFYKENYKNVRSEIAKVDKVYENVDVPRYQDALMILKRQLTEVPGLEKSVAEVDALLEKKQLELLDVQKAKELLDKHTSIYGKTGDVKDSIVKAGLDNIRKELRGFIEDEVRENTGADIRDMNNKVQTSRGILNAIERRSTGGLTKANFSMGDYGTFLSASMFGGPGIGVGAVLIKKIFQSPSTLLRIAKLMDNLSDAKRATVQAELQAGKIPEEFNQFIKGKSNGQEAEQTPKNTPPQ